MSPSFQLPAPLVESWLAALRNWGRERDFSSLMKRHGPALRTIWQKYNVERSALGKLPLSTAATVAPYLLGFHMPNLARNFVILDRLNERHDLNLAEGEVTIIDLGCGTGAWALALSSWLMNNPPPQLEIHVDLIDRSRYLLEASDFMLKNSYANLKIRAARQSLDSAVVRQILQRKLNSKSTLVLLAMGYVWNEVQRNQKTVRAVEELLIDGARSRTPVMFFFSDPAQQDSAMAAMGLREDLVNLGYVPLYPCPGSSPCPLIGRRDWCYSEGIINMPDECARVDRLLGVRRRILGVSGYVFANASAIDRHILSPKKKELKVIVGKPEHRGQIELLLCTQDHGITRKKVDRKSARLRGSLD